MGNPKSLPAHTQPSLTGKNILVVDTSVLIDDHNAINELRKGGNLLVVPLTVINELDNLKTDRRLDHDAQRVIKLIFNLQETGDPSLIVESGMNFSRLNLDQNKGDHQIVACLNYVYLRFVKGHEPYQGYDKVKMITNDFGMNILSRNLNKKYQISVEQYKKSRTKITKKDLEVPLVFVSSEKVAGDWSRRFTFPISSLSKKIPEGSAFIGYSNRKNSKKGEFVAVRRNNFFEIVNPQIESCGIKPKKHEGVCLPNWEQALAMYYCLNPEFDCVFLQGPAGSGKTLIAIAAALEQQRKGLYSKITIFRVPEPVDRKKTLGLLPGDAGAKIGLYLRPIQQALTRLLRQSENHLNYKNNDDTVKEIGKKKTKGVVPVTNGNGNGNGKKVSNLEVHVDDIFEQNGFEIAVLEYVRGENLDEALIIVDDAQNLSRHEIKTLITRVGEGSKVVFTGDLAQIDSPYLDETSSGLAHAIKKMGGYYNVGVVTLRQTLRSRIASLAEKAL